MKATKGLAIFEVYREKIIVGQLLYVNWTQEENSKILLATAPKARTSWQSVGGYILKIPIVSTIATRGFVLESRDNCLPNLKRFTCYWSARVESSKTWESDRY